MTTPPPRPRIRTSDGTVCTLPSAEVVAERAATHAEWAQRAGRPRPVGHEFVHVPAEPLHWSPLARPLAECTVALVSTGGVHLRSQQPFDVDAEVGDWSCRPLPGDTDTADLTVTHTHYATQDALDDVNVMFPLDRLRELADEGVIGAVAALHFGFMGFIPDPRPLVADVVPAAAAELRDRGVDAVLLTAG